MIKKEQVDKVMAQLKLEDNNSNKEYKVIVICNNVINAKKSESYYLPGLYYLIL